MWVLSAVIDLSRVFVPNAGNTADFTLQAQYPPNGASAGWWHWSAATILSPVRVSAADATTSQHRSYFSFLSGIAFEIAGGAAIAILQQLLDPLSHRRDRKYRTAKEDQLCFRGRRATGERAKSIYRSLLEQGQKCVLTVAQWQRQARHSNWGAHLAALQEGTPLSINYHPSLIRGSWIYNSRCLLSLMVNVAHEPELELVFSNVERTHPVADVIIHRRRHGRSFLLTFVSSAELGHRGRF